MKSIKMTALGLAAALGLGLVTTVSTGSLAGDKAASPTSAQLLESLRSKTTRAVNAPLSKDEIARRELIRSLKAKATRGLSMPERKILAKAVENQPKVDMEVYFAFNSDKILPDAEPTLKALGEALRQASTTSDFLVAGHTDAKGRANYNQSLSERRATAIREYLVANFDIPADRLMAVGYGRERLKDPRHPMAAENRRVEVVNMADK